jgi:beta-galactosidase
MQSYEHQRVKAFLLVGFALVFLGGDATDIAMANESPRRRTCFDSDWRFQLADISQAKASDFDDAHWRRLQLPHDWSVEHPFSSDYASGTGYLPGGVGWYRKAFYVSDDWRGREVLIEFDGVQRNSDVWINGHHLGHRPNGYISFQYRLTPHLRFGQKNVIAVRVAREEVADSRWYPGSGIYRHTWLTVVDPIHVDHWGVFITTPRVTDQRADITVSTTVRNDSDKASSLRIVSTLLDPQGKAFSSQSTNATFQLGEKKTLVHWHVASAPVLWAINSPVLYSVVTRIYRDEALIDELNTPFGIRSFHFDPHKGFFLNGQSTLIKGVCMHHDAGVVGAAVPEGVLERRLQRVKSSGFNSVRCSHNPMAPEFYSICDRLGLLVMDEAFDEWELGKRKWVKGRNVGTAERFGYNEHFEEWGVRDVEDMVRRSRNHPSIILWSIGNEIDYPGDPYDHPEFFDPAAPPVDEGSPSATRLAVVAPQLIAAVKKHDTTRPVTAALSNMPASNGVGLANTLDVVGYNYQEQFYEQDHRDFPGRIIYGSENSRSMRSWHIVRDNDYVSSLYLWVGFDFLGEAGEWPNHGSRAGVFDTRGFLKPLGWTYKALWSNEPVVRLFVLDSQAQMVENQHRRGRLRWAEYPRLWSGTPGTTVPVAIISNCENLELNLNGKPLEVTRPDGKDFFRADVPFQPGVLSVQGINGDGQVARDSVTTPSQANRIELLSDRSRLIADGQSVAHVEVRIVDDKGTLVPDCKLPITVKVTGAGRLLGLDNGDQNDTTSLKLPTKSSIDGRVLAILQSTRTDGTIEVSAEAKGLTSSQLRLIAR